MPAHKVLDERGERAIIKNAFNNYSFSLMYEVTLLPIVVSAVVVVVIGFIWYHPKVFGTVWMRLVNITPEALEQGKKRMPITVGVAFLGAMLVAYVMNHFGVAWGVFDVVGAIELAIWSWLGFVAPVMLGIVLWEGRPFKLYLINSLNWLVSFIAIAITLVVL